MIRTKVRKAFTLVEILIVVVILGILAAIVVPQFTNATQDAQGGNIKAQLSSIQRQIELYIARNNGADPDLSADWDDLVVPNAQGQAYLKAAPSNPAWTTPATRTSVTQGTGATGSAASAWFYDTATNTIYASNFVEATGLVSSTATD